MSSVKTLSTNLSLNNGRSFGGNSRVPNPPKPQFYYGQNLNSLVKKSPFLEQQRQAQAASEKVKQNKAHPQVEEPKFLCGRLSPKFRKVAKNDDFITEIDISKPKNIHSICQWFLFSIVYYIRSYLNFFSFSLRHFSCLPSTLFGFQEPFVQIFCIHFI